MDLKNSQARQGRAFRHLWQMKKFGKNCLLFEIVQSISLRTLVQSRHHFFGCRYYLDWASLTCSNFIMSFGFEWSQSSQQPKLPQKMILAS